MQRDQAAAQQAHAPTGVGKRRCRNFAAVRNGGKLAKRSYAHAELNACVVLLPQRPRIRHCTAASAAATAAAAAATTPAAAVDERASSVAAQAHAKAAAAQGHV